jgi:hypothetical protein
MINRRHGFLMIELIFVLGTLAVFALLATRLFYSSEGIFRTSGFVQRDAARFAAATTRLRDDVSNADEVRVVSPNQLQIAEAASPPLQWRIAGDDLVRIAGAVEQHWAINEPTSFAAQGKMVLLCQGQRGEAASAAIPFAPQRDVVGAGGGQ